MKIKMLLAAALCVAVGPMFAQTTTQGAISGTVMDQTDAAIPNAKVLIHNDATNADQMVTSDSAGLFRAPQVAPGTYTVTITVPGFQERRELGVIVQVNSVTSVNPHLEAGDVSTSVEVNGGGPGVEVRHAGVWRPFEQCGDRKYPDQQPPLVRAGADHAGRDK